MPMIKFDCCFQKLLLIAFCLALTACAGFQGKQVPTVDSFGLKNNTALSGIDYDFAFKHQGLDNSEGFKVHQKIIDSTLKASGLFQRVNMGTGLETTHVIIQLNNDTNKELTCLNDLLSIYTLFIIPKRERNDYTMTVCLTKNGSPLKTYTYKDYMVSWTGWCFLPVMPGHMPEKIRKKVVGNMLNSFLKQAIKDGYLKP